ncbi:MAG: hypothetical protein ACFFG0_03615 [Candidatus Thorarchaeota archaeon]
MEKLISKILIYLIIMDFGMFLMYPFLNIPDRCLSMYGLRFLLGYLFILTALFILYH